MHQLVTVYIATHNRSCLLERAIQSVLAQSYPNIELIIADDGSTDDTLTMLRSYIKQKSIHYVRNDSPQGACVARNRAIEIARGEYITGMDDDDELTPNRVTELVTAFESGDYSCVTGSIMERSSIGDLTRRLDCGKVPLDKLLHYNILGNQVLTKTEYLWAIGGFDPAMPAFQDYETWVRLVSRYGDAYKTTDANYIWYTNHVHGRISGCNERRIKAFHLFFHKHHELFKPGHLKSMELLRTRLSGEPFSLLKACKLVNKANIKSVVALYLNRNLSGIKRLIDQWRFRN